MRIVIIKMEGKNMNRKLIGILLCMAFLFLTGCASIAPVKTITVSIGNYRPVSGRFLDVSVESMGSDLEAAE